LVSCVGVFGAAGICFWRHDLIKINFCFEMEGSTAEVQPPKFSLVLESRMRTYLRRDKLAHKKGKSRKLTKADEAEIEEELVVCRFQPQQIRKQAMEEAIHLIQQEEKRRQEEFMAKRDAQIAEVNALKEESRKEAVAEKEGENLAASVAKITE
jgi:hypothetical protein